MGGEPAVKPPTGSRRKRRPDAQVAAQGAECDSVLLKQARTEDAAPWRPVVMSEKAHSVLLSENGLCITSSKGYRSCRASHGAKEGAWYFEVKIEQLGVGGAARLGWAKPEADINASVGADAHGYCYGSRGTKVHNGARELYGREARSFKLPSVRNHHQHRRLLQYRQGDVVGIYIYLPLAPVKSDLVQFNGKRYELDVTEGDENNSESEVRPGSVVFVVNGESQGVAFDGLRPGEFRPSVSLFTCPVDSNDTSVFESASVTVNFGPDFAFPPPLLGNNLPQPLPVSSLVPPKPEDPALPAAEALNAAAGEANSVEPAVLDDEETRVADVPRGQAS